MLTIGLTGGIGSGKSTVSDIFQSLDVPIIDSDLIAREVVEPGEPGLDAIIQLFGSEVLHPDGTLNREHLRHLIFNDASARKQLDQILHPLIRKRSQQQLAALDTPYAILSIPLLVENGLDKSVDRVLVVDCPKQVQIERICKRDNVTPDQARAILAAQCEREQRLQVADDIIDSNTSYANMTQQVQNLHGQYLSLAGSS